MTGHEKHPHIRPLRVGSIISRPPGRAGQLRAGLSRAGDRVGGVTVAGETEIDILRTVKKAVEFLREWQG